MRPQAVSDAAGARTPDGRFMAQTASPDPVRSGGPRATPRGSGERFRATTNEHWLLLSLFKEPHAPKTDTELNDVTGGVVIRIPAE